MGVPSFVLRLALSLLQDGQSVFEKDLVMAALAAVNLVQSAPVKGRSSVASDATDEGQFGEMYARELNKPAESKPAQSAGMSDESASSEEESADADAESPAVPLNGGAAGIDPLLLSLQALTAQSAPIVVPPESAPLEDAPTADLLTKDNPLSALLAGDAQTHHPVLTPMTPETEMSPASGKILPRLADVSASSAQLPAGLAPSEDVLLESDFNEVLQSTLAVPPKEPRVSEASISHPAVSSARHVVAEPVGEGRWGEVVAQRVSMMLGRQEQRLEMQLNPPNLGPMEVRLSLGSEQASIVFTSQHAAVREALAAATPRLTALLADQGIVLTDVQVASDSLNQQQFQQAYQQQDAQKQRGATSAVPDDGIHEPVMLDLGSIRVPVARSGVSLYV